MAPRTISILVLLLSASTVHALPAALQAHATDDDATLTLNVADRVITGDARSWCRVRIDDGATEVPLTPGDQIDLAVYEDDVAGDDEVWHTTYTVTAPGPLSVEFDCSGDFGMDVGDKLELYAQAKIHKAACGTWCLNDTPETANLKSQKAFDDATEEDNSSSTAQPVLFGFSPDRIARDTDWASFMVVSDSDMVVDVLHDPGTGRLKASLIEPDGWLLAQGTPLKDRTRIEATGIGPGQWLVVVWPDEDSDFNFYDLSIATSPTTIETGCSPAAIESGPCGTCGQRQRTCRADGTWGVWAACSGQGACTPGTHDAKACGRCGSRMVECSGQCAWVEGPCLGEGQCAPGASESAACPSGATRTRSCSMACNWSDWSSCTTACPEGKQSPCYTGPSSTASEGTCRNGLKSCQGAEWGPCVGDFVPRPENCRNGLDDDCDGSTDSDDPDCVGRYGQACTSDDACGSLHCLGAPAWPVFAGGSCGLVGCGPTLVCPGAGVCAPLFDTTFCLPECSAAHACRTGQACADTGISRLVCVPRCARDADCKAPWRPWCDISTGLCESVPPAEGLIADAAETHDAADEAAPVVDGRGADVVVVTLPDRAADAGIANQGDGGGCTAGASGSSHLTFLLMMFGVGALRRRFRIALQAF